MIKKEKKRITNTFTKKYNIEILRVDNTNPTKLEGELMCFGRGKPILLNPSFRSCKCKPDYKSLSAGHIPGKSDGNVITTVGNYSLYL